MLVNYMDEAVWCDKEAELEHIGGDGMAAGEPRRDVSLRATVASLGE